MALSLDHRSSLRKLPFPACTHEALKRLQHQCLTFAHKQPSPKEVEVVLEVINEFVFNAGGGKQSVPSPILELQVLQVLLEYFQADLDPSVLFTVYIFLFMDPKQTATMAKLVSLAMAMGSEPILRCAGIWMSQQGASSERCLELAQILVDEYMVVISQAQTTLTPLAQTCPIFVANLMTAIGDLYPTVAQLPPPIVLDLCVAWLETVPLVPFTAVNKTVHAGLPPSVASSTLNASAALTPLIGLARWTILSSTRVERTQDESYARLHLALLESLGEAKLGRDDFKPDVVTVKKVVGLIQTLDMALKSSERTPNSGEDLDRLGQVLQAMHVAECVTGRTPDIITALKKLPSNRLIHMYVVNLAKI